MVEVGIGRTTDGYVYVLVVAICAQVLSGSPDPLGLPVGIDRLLFVLAVVMLVVRERGRLLAALPVVPTLLVLLTVTSAASSALIAGTMWDRSAFFALADSFGVIPFFLFLTAPVAFRDEARRRILLIGLSITGLYLGITGFLEGVHAYRFVWPAYIGDPGVGLHFGRARGPFLSSGADGLALIMCSLAAVLLLTMSKSRALLWLTYSCLLSCAFASFFTLTRSVWIAYVVAFTILMLSQRRLWKWWGLLAGGATLTVGLALSVFSTLQEQVTTRLNDEMSGLDRLNANSAAFEVLRHQPLFGVGWHSFSSVEVDWLWQNSYYPMTATGIPVHNVLLGYATEIGIPGTIAWVALFLLAIRAAVRRPWPLGVQRWWPVVTLAFVSSWFVIGNLVPITYAFPSAVLWTWLGAAAQVAESSTAHSSNLTRKSVGALL